MWYYTYCRLDGMKSYKCFDINEGVPVGNRIYATLLQNTEENQAKLQHLADLNKEINLSVQLRDGKGKIVFQTR